MGWKENLNKGLEIEGKSKAGVWHRFKMIDSVLHIKLRSTKEWVVCTQDTLNRQKYLRPSTSFKSATY